MRLVLLGPPGAGKGTQAKVLSKRWKLPHVSTGDLFREAIARKTPLGLRVESFVKGGKLVPDETVVELTLQRLEAEDAQKGFILDGFPRTVRQGELLEAALKAKGQRLDRVLYFATSTATVLDRLGGRRVCGQCGANYHVRNLPPRKAGICDACGGGLVQRPDDNPSTIRKRLEEYEEKTRELIAYYRKAGILREVPGDLDVEQLYEKLLALLSGEGLSPAGSRKTAGGL